MPLIQTRDGTEIFYKELGRRERASRHPSSTGYPLNADSFDRLAMKLVEAGHRVINYDRRGAGRSGHPWGGYDWDTYSDDLADVMQATGATSDVTVIGYSMGGGECARYMSRHGGKGVIKLGLYASVVPGNVQVRRQPGRAHRAGLSRHRSTASRKDAPAFFRNTFLPPFYGKGIKSAVGMAHAASDELIETATAWAIDDEHEVADG